MRWETQTFNSYILARMSIVKRFMFKCPTWNELIKIVKWKTKIALSKCYWSPFSIAFALTNGLNHNRAIRFTKIHNSFSFGNSKIKYVHSNGCPKSYCSSNIRNFFQKQIQSIEIDFDTHRIHSVWVFIEICFSHLTKFRIFEWTGNRFKYKFSLFYDSHWLQCTVHCTGSFRSILKIFTRILCEIEFLLQFMKPFIWSPPMERGRHISPMLC